MENNNHILSLYQFGGHSVLPVHEIYPHENQSTGPKFLGGGGAMGGVIHPSNLEKDDLVR